MKKILLNIIIIPLAILAWIYYKFNHQKEDEERYGNNSAN